MRKYGLLIFVLLIGLLLVSCDPNVSDEEIKNYTLKSVWLYEQIGETWYAKLDINEIKTISFQKVKPLGTPDKEWNVDNTDNGYIKCYAYGTSGNYNLYFVGKKIIGNADSQGMFAGFENLTSISFGHFDTSYVTNMNCMFCGCKSIKNLDLSSFNLSKVTNAENMFYSFGTVGTTVKIASGYNDFFEDTDLGDIEFWSYKSNTYTCVADPEIPLKVTFYNGDSVWKTETNVSYGDTLYLGSYIPTKDNYGFFGWYTDKDRTKYFDGTEPIKKDTTLYAKWLKGKTTAYIDANITLTELSLEEDDIVTAEFSADDYTLRVSAKIANTKTKTVVLDSFAVAASGTITIKVYSSGKDGVKGTPVLKGTAQENVTFENGMTYNILVQKPGNYRVSFDTNGGSLIDSQVVVPGNTATVPPINSTKNGYEFAGWYADKELSGSPYDFSTPVNSDLTLYAKWEKSTTTEKWCVMTYMDFSDLSNSNICYGLMNLDEICQTTPNENVKAYFITGGANNSSVSYSAEKYPNLAKALQPYSTDNPFGASAVAGKYQYWEYTSDGKFNEITPSSKGMNDSNVLLDFIKKCYSWAKSSDPKAKFKYILELWDHGGGSYVGLIQDSAVNAKKMEGTIMSLSDCGKAIKAATEDPKFKFEVVIFDMCLMQSIEAAHTVSYNCANYIIGSQTSSSAIGSAYTDWFNFLYSHPEASGYGFGEVFCDTAYKKLMKDGNKYFQKNITWSVLDMSELEALETAYENYSASVLNSLSAQNVETYLAAIDSMDAFNPNLYEPLWEYYMYDINVFTNKVGISTYRTELMNAVNKAIVYKRYGETTENEGCCGLSMCILTTQNGWEEWNYSTNWNNAYYNDCLTANYRTFQKRILSP